jgi:Ca2+-binding EF-hand superfamily protein
LDGKVQIDEVISILAQSGLFLESKADPNAVDSITIEDVRQVLAGIDYDRDQIIEFNEFLLIVGNRAEILSDMNLINLFQQLDEVEPGKVAISDVKTFF